MHIRTFGNPCLRIKCKSFTGSERVREQLKEDMLGLLHRTKGLGLASTQIADDGQYFVLNVGQFQDVFVSDPVLVDQWEPQVMQEGCLSLPTMMSMVPRFNKIKVEANFDGVRKVLEVVGIEAQVFQHEIDHLNGMLFMDRLSRVKREMMKAKIARLRRRGMWPTE